MDATAATWLVLAVAAITANLPFINERLAVVGPRLAPKSLGWRVLELLLMAVLAIGVGVLLEGRMGQIHRQGWQFYAAMGCLFLTLAFPGFVWRYLRRQHP